MGPINDVVADNWAQIVEAAEFHMQNEDKESEEGTDDENESDLNNLITSLFKQQFKGLSIYVGVCVQKFLVSIHSKLLS